MILGYKKLTIILLLSILTSIFIDYSAKGMTGYYISICIFIFLLLTTLYNFKIGIYLFIFTALIIPQFSRSLVAEVVESDNLNIANFYSLHSTTLFGLALPVLYIILIGMYSIFCLYKSRATLFKKNLSEILLWLIFLTILLLLSTLINVLDGRENQIKDLISDLRLIITWFFGVFIYRYISVITTRTERFRYFFNVLVFSVLVVGLRTILFILVDVINHTQSYDFSTLPYIGYPIFFTIIYVLNNVRLKWLMLVIAALSAFSLKRSDLAFFVILLVLYFIVGIMSKQRQYQLSSLKSFMYVLGAIIAINYTLFIFAEDAYMFMLYKLNFFTVEMWEGNLSNSAMIRQLEFINIYNDSISRVYPFFIGSGLGGYFDFSYSIMPNVGVSDFSSLEIERNKFVRPHTFFNFIYLKGGIIYLTFYLMLTLSMIFIGIKAISKSRFDNYKNAIQEKFVLFFSIGYSVFCLNMFWQPLHAFIFIFLLCMLIDYIKENKNVINNS
ncbi:hypothetical protein M0L70_RS15085 [Providencia rettgeri]|nr:hypothetical protein [Providencia rettgeri]